MRLWPLFIVSALFHGYAGLRLLPALADWVQVWVLTGALVVSALSMPLGLVGQLLARSPAAEPAMRVLTWVGLLCMGFFSSLMVLTLVRDGGLLVLWAASSAVVPANALSAENMSRLSAQAVPVLAAAVTLWGFVNARRTAAVVRVDVPLTGLAPALHGFTLAQISDIHVGPTIKRHYL